MARRILLGILIFTSLMIRLDFVRGSLSGSLIWSRIQENFVPIDNITAFRLELLKHLRRSRELEDYNFQRKALRVTYYEEPNIVHFYDDDTKITGVCGEVWNMLSNYLNFSMITIRAEDGTFGEQLENGSYTGLVGMLLHNDADIILRAEYYTTYTNVMDYTFPLWYNSYRLYIKPETGSDGSWVVRMFSRTVWFSLLLLFLFLSVLGFGMQHVSRKVTRDKSVHHEVHDHLFHTFAMFCGQGFVPESVHSGTKLLGFTKTIFAWVLLISVSTHLTSFAANFKGQPPFKDLATMFNQTDYRVIVQNGSVMYPKFKREVNQSGALKHYSKRIINVKSLQRLYEKGCWGKKKYALLDSEDRKRAYGRLKCNLAAIGEPYLTALVAGGVAKNFKYKKTLDSGLLKLHECGLVDVLQHRWFGVTPINVDPSVAPSVTFDEVWMVFAILGVGIIASSIVFVFENIVFVYRQNQGETRRRRSFYPQFV